jgi:hypothetical protein
VKYDDEKKPLFVYDIVCSFDSTVSDNGEEKFWIGNSIYGANVDAKSEEERYSGNYSIKLDSNRKFGGTIELSGLKESNFIQIEIKRFEPLVSNAMLVLSTPNSTIYKTVNAPTQRTDEKWQTLKVEMELPPGIENEEKVSIYCWNNGKGVAYFDDLKVKVFRKKIYPEYEEKALELTIKKEELKKLKKARSEALKVGVLQNKKWVKGKLKYGEESFKVKVRLKGDWTDHLLGEKWSFRIKMDEEKTWNGMKEFSIQTPASRSYLDEWVYHKMCEQEDVLSTRYGFVPVKFNKQSIGIYAYEEHFTKHLVENRKRREGVILKFDETGLWEDMRLLKQLKKENYHMRPYYNSCMIEPFKEKRTLRKAQLYQYLLNGQNIVQKYKEGISKNVGDYFELRKLAYYYAVTDLLMAKHAFKWHNQRFYYNPAVSKLEMVAYDGYGGFREESDSNAIVFAHNKSCNYNLFFEDDIPTYYPLNDPVFLKEYNAALKRISSKDYIEDFVANIQGECSRYEKLLSKEFVDYSYNFDHISKRADEINTLWLDNFKNSCKPNFNWDVNNKIQYPDSCNFWELSPSISLNVYRDRNKLYCKNFHCNPIKIVGIGGKKELEEELMTTIQPGLFTENYVELAPNRNDCKYLYFKEENNDVMHKKLIANWPIPTAGSVWQGLKSKQIPNSVGQLVGDTFFLNQGDVELTDHVYFLPAEITLHAKPGTKLELKKGAGLVIEGNMVLKGLKDRRITITSNGFNNGLCVIGNKKDTSYFHYVDFSNLVALNYEGWQLTGACSFYETNVIFNSVNFVNSKSEDALNTIRSNFELKNCSFETAASDAFDADFCEGVIESSNFLGIGNDGIDFSGSNVTGSDIHFEKIGDKGISIGENSSASFTNIFIKNAKVGVASKDFSQTTISKIKLERTEFGFTAYKKKPEYGPASIVVSDFNQNDVNKLVLVDLDSKVVLPNKSYVGDENLKIDEILY